ncbi:unnamed protein product [Paramecium sonneborni]|uniref:G domain-containing protein n=1 Tax=Paramecium sonneborni TaxID=65129 RepID=A0A8S1PXX6_9CILI|nr:unnamed protein product [Paramecium sonneborni]
MNSQDQKQEQEDKVKESILMKIIGNAQRLFDEFNMNKKQKMSVVLLIGVTGSGKSTIFNFLSGADFSFNNDKVELEIKNPQNHYSKMATGTNSITKEPNFYHNKQNNHLIIDFPGFQDTNGDQDQLLFELFFQKIVTSGPLKIIYVIKNTESTLPNRATDLQEFIKQLCQKGNIKFEKLNLLLNCYMENLSDEKLQKKSKRSQNLLIYHYQLIKYFYDGLQKVFNDQKRQQIWQNIQQMQPITIKLQKLPKSQIISEYLRRRILITIQKYGNVLQTYFDKQFQYLSDSQMKAAITQMENLLDLVNGLSSNSSFEWYTKYIQICEQLAKSLSIQDDIITHSNNFRQIFTYYQQFSDIIQGYEDIKILKIIAEDQLKNIKNLINQRLEFLKTKLQYNVKVTQLEKDKQQQDSKIQTYEQEIKNLSAQGQENTKEIKDLNDRLKKAQESKSTLNEQIQNLINNQQQQNQQFLAIIKQQHRDEVNGLRSRIYSLENKSSCQLI